MSLKNYFLRKFNSLKIYRELYEVDSAYVLGILLKKVLNSKVFHIFVLMPFLPLLLPIVLFMRMIRFFFTIRMGNLESNAIGHFSLPVEIYLSELECGIHKNTRVLDLWYLHKKVCNKALERKWREHLIILPRLIIQPLYLINKIIPGGRKNEIPYRSLNEQIHSTAVNEPHPWQSVDIYDVISKTNPRIVFTNDEKSESEKILKEAGFDPYKKYVCIHNRDDAYHSDASTGNHRNSSIHDFREAVNYLLSLGYHVIRMGSKVKGELKIKSPLYFDYARSGIRSELLDLFLVSQCSFFVGNGSGIVQVSGLFRKIAVFLDFSSLGTIPDLPYNSLVIFRRIKARGEILSIPEIIEKGYDRFTRQDQFKKAGIELINNSNEEIRSVIWEAHARLNNIWESSQQDEDSQNLFRHYFSEETNQNNIRARIGSEFLRLII